MMLWRRECRLDGESLGAMARAARNEDVSEGIIVLNLEKWVRRVCEAG